MGKKRRISPKKRLEGEIEADARAFVDSNLHICPFGKMAEREGQVAYAVIDKKDVEGSTKEAVKAFLRSKSAAVLVFPEVIHGLETSEEVAIEIMLAAATHIGKALNPQLSMQEVRAEVEEEIGIHLKDPYSNYNPVMRADYHNGEPSNIFAGFMGPCYKRGHTRWAPRPMVVLTWAFDIDLATEENPKWTNLVRKRMRKAFGGDYDANALFLDEKPFVTEPVKKKARDYKVVKAGKLTFVVLQ